MSDQPNILTLEQAARRLAVHPRTVRRLTDKGALTKVRVSEGRVGVSDEEITAYIRGGGWQSGRIVDATSSSSCKGESAYSVAVQPESRKRKRKNSKRDSGESGSTGMNSATRKT